MKIAFPSATTIKFFVVLLVFVASTGCSSNETGNVASDASQSEIDRYNQLIEEEAAKARQTADDKNI